MCVVGEGEGRRGREGGREGEGREGGGWEGGKETNCMMTSGPCVGIYTVSYVLTEGMEVYVYSTGAECGGGGGGRRGREGREGDVLTEGMFIALVLSVVAYAVMSQWKTRLMLFSN